MFISVINPQLLLSNCAAVVLRIWVGRLWWPDPPTSQLQKEQIAAYAPYVRLSFLFRFLLKKESLKVLKLLTFF
jgi:hypothetical protein